ncbi:MAG: sulfatase family protein [Solirubrobacterales bacterium]
MILVLTDDQTLAQFTPEAMPQTTALVADAGTRFANLWVSTALCCPSRAVLLTGQYGHNNGVLANSPGYPALVDPENTLPAWLQRAGYTTSHIGKYLNGYGQAGDGLGPGPGWERWHTAFGPYYYGFNIVDSEGARTAYEGEHATEVLNEIALEEVRELGEQGSPYFLQIDHRAPHTEGENDTGGPCSGYAIPAPEDLELFKDAQPPRSPSFNEADVSDKPGFLQAEPLSEAKVSQLGDRWGCALASLASVDRGVGDLLGALEETGQLQRTVILFTSDNGLFYGEHRIPTGKVVPYPEAHHMPLAIRAPAAYLGEEGAVGEVAAPVSNVDIPPTILELAGAKPCIGEGECRVLDGRSLVPAIAGENDLPTDRALLYEYRAQDAGGFPTCEFTGVKTPRAMLTHHTRAAIGEECVEVDELERYDLDGDPHAEDNLCAAGCPATGEQDELARRLERLEVCAGIEGRDPRPASGEYCE